VNESTLSLHQVELVVDPGKYFCDSSGVGDHADSAHDLGEVASWDDGWRLLVDTALEARWAPVDELDGSFGLDRRDSSVDVLRDDISAVHEATSHLLPVARVAFSHHRRRLESGVSDLGD